MKYLLFFIGVILISTSGYSQKYITKNGHINFFSHTPVEDIEADNHTVNCALDTQSGAFVFKLLMKSFEFEKALMQEHFNENYVESDEYPSAILKAKVINIKEIDFNQDGKYSAHIEGELTIHGVTKKIKEKGMFIVNKDKVKGESKFNINPAHYEIKIPKAVIKNIAEEIEVTVDVELEKLK